MPLAPGEIGRLTPGPQQFRECLMSTRVRQNVLFEGPSRIINDETGETVGIAANESMDVRIMQNAPYAPNQH